jgi:hypothetical protein
MQLFDVDVHDHWALLIGRDVHRVVYHSVFKDFSNEFERISFFEDVDLVKAKLFTPIVGVDLGAYRV